MRQALVAVLRFHRIWGLSPVYSADMCKLVTSPSGVLPGRQAGRRLDKGLCDVNFRPLEVLSQELTHGSQCFRGLGPHGGKDASVKINKQKSPQS